MNTKSMMVMSAALVSLFAVQSALTVEDLAPDKDGFIRDWLMLAPIQMESDTDGAAAIDKNQIPDEGQIKPKAGDKTSVSNKELTWKKIKADDYYVDFNGILKDVADKAVGYLVCYLRTDEERKELQLKMGSNDEGKVYLNGKALLKSTEPRPLDQDSDVARNVTLNKGVNVLVFKVFNEGGSDWQGCLRFTDAKGKAVKDLVIRLEP